MGVDAAFLALCEENERRSVEILSAGLCPTCVFAEERGERPVPAHGNCLYAGQNRMGHSKTGHCTADACY